MTTKPHVLAIAGLFASLLASSALHAQAVGDTLPRYEVPGVTVTATRTPIERRVVPQRIDLVTWGEIERSGARNVAGALRATTAIDVIAFPGLLTGVSVRGFRPQYGGLTSRTLILLDGRPAGTNNPALLDIGNVERIEVLRGPASALYGSSAMGGVVNVITRHSTEGLAGAATGSYGAFGDYDARARAGGELGFGFDFDLAAAAVGRHEGYRTGSNRTFGKDALVKTLADGSTTSLPWVSPDSVIGFSEFRGRTGQARLGRRLGERWRVDVKGEGYVGDDVQNPGDLTPQDWDTRSLKDVERRSAEVLLSGTHGRSSPRLRLFSALEAVDYFSAPVAPHFVSFRTPIRTRGAQAQNAYALGPATLTAGADYTSAAAESQAFSARDVRTAPYAPDSAIRSAAAFAQGVWTGLDARLHLSGGLRADRIDFEILTTPELSGYETNRETHAVVSPNAGARFDLVDGLQLYGNFGRAFVAPDAFFVAGYSERRAGIGRRSVFVTRGNPDLRPERSVTWDAGVSIFRDAAGLDAEVGYFHTRVADRIAASFGATAGVELTAAGDTVLSTTSYVNADEATIRGLEARLSYDLGGALGSAPGLRLFANATRILEAEERYLASGAEQRVRNVADLTAVAGIDYDSFDRLSGRLSARYVGERVDADYVAWWAPGEIRYPAHLVLDLTTRVRLGARYHLGLEIHNLTDEDYFEVRGYGMPGRSAAITAAIHF